MVPAAWCIRGSVELGSGHVLLAYSDGIVELLNDADEEFGYARLEAQLRRSKSTLPMRCCFRTWAPSGISQPRSRSLTTCRWSWFVGVPKTKKSEWKHASLEVGA